jgi:gamma-glutamylputrescine oxidase
MSGSPQGWYAESAGAEPERASLSSSRKADICIIGAGYTGLSAALHAAQTGARVIVVEAERVGFGASGRNGGQIHTGLRKEQSELEQWLGAAHARDLWSLSEEAKALVRSLIARHGIACDLKPGLIIAAHDRRAAEALTQDTQHLATHYGYRDAQMLSADETANAIGSRIYCGGKLDMGGGHLHPLNFARGLALAAERAGAEIFEQSKVVALEETPGGIEARCETDTVLAGKAILATDAFSGVLVPRLARYIGHIESFVTATAPLPEALRRQILPEDEAVADTRHVLDYYRKSADGRMLFAGREAYFGIPKEVARLVRPRMLRVFPQLQDVPTEFAWSGTVGITVTRMPHFGTIGERLLFAHGWSGQGVALATLGGRLLAEAAQGHEERFEVFARVPARAFPGGQMLRKPLLATGLLAFKLLDAV